MVLWVTSRTLSWPAGGSGTAGGQGEVRYCAPSPEYKTPTLACQPHTCDSLIAQGFAGRLAVQRHHRDPVGRVGEQLHQLDIGFVPPHQSDLCVCLEKMEYSSIPALTQPL